MRYIPKIASVALLIMSSYVWKMADDTAQVDKMLVGMSSFVFSCILVLIAFHLPGGVSKTPISETYEDSEIDPRHEVPTYLPDGRLLVYRRFGRDKFGNLKSVSYGDREIGNWGAGWNSSDRIPTMKNRHGLYGAYTPDSPVLDEYSLWAVLAAVALDGRIAFDQYVARGQYGEVIDILEERPSAWDNVPLRFYDRR